jgi:hypothetical protein
MNDKTIYDEYYYRAEGKIEKEFLEANLSRPDQASAAIYTFADGHRPEVLLSIGAGAGILEKWLEPFIVRIIGTDPSAAAKRIYRGKEFHQMNFLRSLEEFGSICDTIICCEMIEHIDPEEFRCGLEKLRSLRVRLIVTNRLAYHPIELNNWDHVNKIDDETMDQIANLGHVRFRHGSHIIVDINQDE